MGDELEPGRAEDEVVPAAAGGLGSWWSRLAVLLGLTGFAVSQPLLGVAGEDPSLFTFAGVDGWDLVVFALVVALAPPLALWLLVLVAGLVGRRVADVVFLGLVGSLAAAVAIQWAKTIAGLDRGWVLGLLGLAGGMGFALAVVRFRAVLLWTRYTAVLPVISVVLFLLASPSGDLLRGRQDGPARTGDETELADAPASVVFVMFDELPLETLLAEDDSIDEVRFPNFAALAGESTWYRDYTAQANGTVLSVPSILTGRVPQGNGALWTAHPDNLFSLMAPTHDLNAVEMVTQLCGYTDCALEGAEHADRGGVGSVLSQVAEVWLERVALRALPEADLEQFAAAAEAPDPEGGEEDGGWRGPRSHNAAAPGSMLDFAAALSTADSPSLNYLHLMLPHQPWVRYPDGRAFDGWSRVELNQDGIERDDWVMAQLNQVHLFQTMYADRLLGDLVESMRSAGTYDDSLVVITADHGIGFGRAGSGSQRDVDLDTVGSVAYVPLFIKSPGQEEGRVDESNLMGIDLLPTIAAELGIEVPWVVDGFAAGSPEIAERGEQKLFYDFGSAFGGELEEIIEFSGAEHRPSVGDRPVGSIRPGEHSLAALARTIEADEWLGLRLEDLDRPLPEVEVSLGGGEVKWGGLLHTPGRLDGELESASAGGIVLLAVDGEIQSASPVDGDGRFVLLVPPEVEPHRALEIQFLHVEGGRG